MADTAMLTFGQLIESLREAAGAQESCAVYVVTDPASDHTAPGGRLDVCRVGAPYLDMTEEGEEEVHIPLLSPSTPQMFDSAVHTAAELLRELESVRPDSPDCPVHSAMWPVQSAIVSVRPPRLLVAVRCDPEGSNCFIFEEGTLSAEAAREEDPGGLL